MVPPASARVSRVPAYSGSRWSFPDFAYRIFTFFDLLSQNSSAIVPGTVCGPQPPKACAFGFGLFPFRSPLLWKSSFLSSPAGTEMFQFPASPSAKLCIYFAVPEVYSGGLPHSEISGSMAMCASPKLIAACHVFHRLPVPRHSPCALYILTFALSRGHGNFASFIFYYKTVRDLPSTCRNRSDFCRRALRDSSPPSRPLLKASSRRVRHVRLGAIVNHE